MHVENVSTMIIQIVTVFKLVVGKITIKDSTGWKKIKIMDDKDRLWVGERLKDELRLSEM